MSDPAMEDALYEITSMSLFAGWSLDNAIPNHTTIMNALSHANISVDARHLGMRVSTHIYNDSDDVQQFIDVVKQHC